MARPIALREGTFTANGQSSTALELRGKANVLVYGGTATVQIERSFDNGVSWQVLSRDSAGNPASYVIATNPINAVIEEWEVGVLYRLTVTAFTATVTYRISQ